LIELLTALSILALLALLSYRGLAAVLDAREHVDRQAEKWQRVARFFARFGEDVQLAAPRPVRAATGSIPPWRGRTDATSGPHLEFSRFAPAEGVTTARRLAYGLNDSQEIELWVWPGLDVAPGVAPARYPMLAGVTRFELRYLDAGLGWVGAWPVAASDPLLPRAVQVRITLASGEEIVRVFALQP
jgi:general secretion pathway protein J